MNETYIITSEDTFEAGTNEGACVPFLPSNGLNTVICMHMVNKAS